MPPTWTPQIFKFFYFSLQMCMDPLRVRRHTPGKPPGAYKQPPRTLQGHSAGPPEGLWTAFRTPMFNMFSSTKTTNKQCEKQHKCGPFKAVTTATLKPVFEKTQTNKQTNKQHTNTHTHTHAHPHTQNQKNRIDNMHYNPIGFQVVHLPIATGQGYTATRL